MSDRHGARRHLRAGTADLHDRVDAVFSAADLSSRDGYARFLVAQAAAHLSVEAALTRADAGRHVGDWPERQRGDLLRRDLAELGVAAPEPVDHAVPGSAAAVIGGVYVLEGSRLGGTMLERAVAPGLPRAFLSAADPARWRTLLQVIDEALQTPEDMAEATDAARAVFATFERSARTHLGMEAQA